MHENASVISIHRGNHKHSSSTLRFSVILSPIRCAWLTREMLRLGISFFIMSWNNDMLHIIICDRLFHYLIFSDHCSSNCFIILSFIFVSSYIFYIYRNIFLWNKRRKREEIGERTSKRRSKNERKKRELMILIRIILSPREDCFI